jgi:hypothetical protein
MERSETEWPPDGRRRMDRQKEEAFWVERHDRIPWLEARWNFISSRGLHEDASGPRCQWAVHGRQCEKPRVAGAAPLAPIPLWCRFHFLTDFAAELALLLRDDPEAVSKPFFAGCVRSLVGERLPGGPTAQEAHEALEAICGALLAWPPGGQGQHAEGR